MADRRPGDPAIADVGLPELLDARSEKGSRVYFVQAEHGGPIKIGYCGNKAGVRDRRASLQTGNPLWLVVRREVRGSRATEAHFHRYFDGIRLAGEWFLPTEELAEVAHAVAMPAEGEADAWSLLRDEYERGYEDGLLDGGLVGGAQYARRLIDIIKNEVELEHDERTSYRPPEKGGPGTRQLRWISAPSAAHRIKDAA